MTVIDHKQNVKCREDVVTQDCKLSDQDVETGTTLKTLSLRKKVKFGNTVSKEGQENTTAFRAKAQHTMITKRKTAAMRKRDEGLKRELSG